MTACELFCFHPHLVRNSILHKITIHGFYKIEIATKVQPRFEKDA
jgi:hypothetical protein